MGNAQYAVCKHNTHLLEAKEGKISLRNLSVVGADMKMKVLVLTLVFGVPNLRLVSLLNSL